MSPLHLVARTFSVIIIVAGAGVACAQDYPNRPIRIVTAEVGATNDFVSRTIAPLLSSSVGQPVIVDNRGTPVAIQTVAKAPPQGYTLLIVGNPFWISPLLQNVSYDPVQDFAPISMANRAPSILVVHPSVAANSVKELIALAKARPGELNYASGPAGGSAQLAAELFKAMAGVAIVGITYKGGGPAFNDLLGGQVQVMFVTPAGAMPHIKSGKVRALAVTSAQPTALAPGLPTMAASGVPGYESEQVSAVFTPAKTPAAIINRLNQEIVQILRQPDVKDRFFKATTEAVGSSPEELAAMVKSEMSRIGKMIKDAGIRSN